MAEAPNPGETRQESTAAPGRRGFEGARARQRTAAAVREVESQTGAEVVVALRPISGHYRHADYLFGLVTGLAALAGLLYLPVDFPLAVFPVDVAIGFAVGTVLCSWLPSLRRRLVVPSLLRENVRRAARAAFVDLGVGRTSGRTGMLVYISLFERRVEVVADIGLDFSVVERRWSEAVGALQSGVSPRYNFERLISALRGLGPVLECVAPRSPDDVNELPDERMSCF